MDSWYAKVAKAEITYIIRGEWNALWTKCIHKPRITLKSDFHRGTRIQKLLFLSRK